MSATSAAVRVAEHLLQLRKDCNWYVCTNRNSVECFRSFEASNERHATPILSIYCSSAAETKAVVKVLA